MLDTWSRISRGLETLTAAQRRDRLAASLVTQTRIRELQPPVTERLQRRIYRITG